MADPEKFHYTLPDSDDSSRWGGLSPSAREALSGVVAGPTPAEQLLPSDRQPEKPNTHGLTPEVAEWASAELEAALQGWNRYRPAILPGTPQSVDELADSHPRYEEVISYLFEARKMFRSRGTRTTVGENLGEKVGLVLLPWEALKTMQQKASYMAALRGEQARILGLNVQADEMSKPLDLAIQLDQPIYRTYKDPSTLLRSSEYLDERIMNDGPWGIMLVQKGYAGQQGDSGTTPDQFTRDGSWHHQLLGFKVDAMGIFEWLSFTLQEGPHDIDDTSLLLANRMAESWVPYGQWDNLGYQFKTRMQKAADAEHDARARIAVMAFPGDLAELLENQGQS